MHKVRLGEIDALRFIAAVSVAMFHLAFWSWAPEAAYSTSKAVSLGRYSYESIQSIASLGWVGVEIFFVISGFVIVYSATGGPWRFLRSRLLRLVPAVWICAPVTAAVLIYFSVFMPSDIIGMTVRSLVFWPKGPWVDGVYWTLGVEISFYALMFVLLVIGRLAWINLALCLVGLLSSAYWLAALPIGIFPVAHIDEMLARLLLIRHGCFFAIGGLLWTLQGTKAGRGLWLVILTCMAAGYVEILDAGREPVTLAGPAWLSHIAAVTWVASVGFLILAVKRELHGHRWQSPCLRAAGLATFPLYLLHDVVGAWLLRVSSWAGLSRWVALALSLFAVIGLSFLVSHIAEPVVRTGLRRLIDSRYFRRIQRIVEYRYRNLP
ncbi:acyltransferase family protein [Sphingomonas crocodyli]|uniref:Acyltransferase n=1 Tax=Sphingomonas crocodyli TaxID=1979270 RepID=A0A437LXI9_9SPHN|nr:acyltransferase [Sphingomonas crocodyli]RVT90121.1 acyltransferase [Sphingomonas crocodyli]